MGIVQIKNPDLYKKWIAYFEKHRPTMKSFERRAFAFLNSNAGEKPPSI